MEDETTDLNPLHPTTQKVNELLELQQITQAMVDELSPEVRKALFRKITNQINSLQGEALDAFYQKVNGLISPENKKDIWENNHAKIQDAIEHHILTYGAMPSQGQLVDKTGLSRQTVAKHLKEYEKNSNYHAQQEQLKFMSNHLLVQMYRKALKGDTKAANIYFRMIGAFEQQATGKRTLVQNQNNYLQINNTVLSQDKLNQLTPAQLSALEGMVNASLHLPPLPQPEPVEE